MNIAVVYGTMHKGSTYHCVQLILNKLSASQELKVSEFFLPRDMPHFCSSCFSCFLHGEHTCPHYSSIKPIADAFDEAELIILASPSYVLDVSGQMKAALDHFGYQWMPHRPNAKMFRKIGVAVSTAAGAGAGRTNKTMKKSMDFWGAKRVFTYGTSVGAMGWEDVKPEKKEKITRQIVSLSKKNRCYISKSRQVQAPTVYKNAVWNDERDAKGQRLERNRPKPLGKARLDGWEKAVVTQALCGCVHSKEIGFIFAGTPFCTMLNKSKQYKERLTKSCRNDILAKVKGE